VHDLDLRTLVVLYGSPDGRGAFWALMVGLTLLGGGWPVIALVPLVLWPGWPRTRRFARLLALAVLVQATLVWGIKLATGRVRPWIAMSLAAPIGAPHDGSFPSGHAAGSFCVASFLLIALPAAFPGSPNASRAAGAVAVVFAALVALSRVYLGAHFPSDVLAGAVLGASVGVAAGGLYASREVRRAVEG
jgi:undecaprenyl-diphosphatase